MFNLTATLFLIPFFASLAITTGVGVIAWRRNLMGARLYALVAFSQSIWTLGYIFELVSPTIEGKIFWDNFQFIPSFLWFFTLLNYTFDYADRKLRRPRVFWGSVMAFPLLFIILAYSDPYHHLIRPTAALNPGKPFAELTYDFTPLFYLWAAYGYFFLFWGLAIMLRYYIRHPFYRTQVGIIMVGALVPLIGTVLTISGVRLTFHRDTTPLTFAISNVIIIVGLFKYKLFDLVPVARDLIFDTMQDAVIVVDSDSRIMDVNASALRELGMQAKEVIGRSTLEVYSAWRAVAESLQSVETEIVQELRWDSPEGTRYFQIKVSPLREADGSIAGQVIVVSGITQHKQTEEIIRQHAAQLEIANAELEAFAHTVSHDLRAPLRAINGYLSIVMEDHASAFTPEAARYLTLARQNAVRMDELINDLLQLTRLSLLEMRAETLNMEEIAHQVIAEMLLEHQGCEIAFSVGTLPPCRADGVLMKQVFVNLIGNAIKFTNNRPGAAVTVGFLREAEEIIYYVRDTGVGFNMAYTGKLFEIFERLHSADEYEGTGVGLAIVKRIVDRHGGRVWAEGEEGAGATFYFVLPES